MVLDAALLSTQHYKVQMPPSLTQHYKVPAKGKWSNPEKRVAPSLTPWCSS